VVTPAFRQAVYTMNWHSVPTCSCTQIINIWWLTEGLKGRGCLPF